MGRLLNVTISFTEIRHSPIYITGLLLWSYWTQYLYIVTIANVCASFIPAGFILVCPPNQLLNLRSNKLHFHRNCSVTSDQKCKNKRRTRQLSLTEMRMELTFHLKNQKYLVNKYGINWSFVGTLKLTIWLLWSQIDWSVNFKTESQVFHFYSWTSSAHRCLTVGYWQSTSLPLITARQWLVHSSG